MAFEKQYDELAADYDKHYNPERGPYLINTEKLIVDRLGQAKQSSRIKLLDVGAGPGTRTKRIEGALNCNSIALDLSLPMCKSAAQKGLPSVNADATRLPVKPSSLDAITCLWNVFGHMFPAKQRILALKEFKRALKKGGLVFLDVNNRHNLREYRLKVFATMLRHRLSKEHDVGDVLYKTRIGSKEVPRKGHVFTRKEFEKAIKESGLEIVERIYVDYSTGQATRFSFQGQLFYILRK